MGGTLEILDNLIEENKTLKQQLQSYKDKEYKLREYITNESMSGTFAFQMCDVSWNTYENVKKDILQILNEGSDN